MTRHRTAQLSCIPVGDAARVEVQDGQVGDHSQNHWDALEDLMEADSGGTEVGVPTYIRQDSIMAIDFPLRLWKDIQRTCCIGGLSCAGGWE